MSRQDALLRLRLEAESTKLIPWLKARYPNDIAGVWFPLGATTINFASVTPERMEVDPDLARYAHRSSLIIIRSPWSARQKGASTRCLFDRVGQPSDNAQVNISTDDVGGQVLSSLPDAVALVPDVVHDGRARISAADNAAGRTFLTNPVVAQEIAASDGLFSNDGTHPAFPPGVPKGG